MGSDQVDILDCKVRVRKYVLISCPTRWKQKGERVVVQSPMLNILKTVSKVPVKRYNGEEQNSVCFIPKQDIEKDISSIYENAKVSTTESWVDAHGVAIFDNTLGDGFTYRRGDRFWICIGTKTGFNDVVPVINLSSQTFEEGNIRIDQVCWFPQIQGPNGELWTLGGETRQLKLSGRKNYSYLSFAICQLLDGTAPTTEIVPMPAKDIKMETRRQLSIAESRSLFMERLQCMGGAASDKAILTGEFRRRSQSPAPPDRTSPFLPTPPASPDQDLLHRGQHSKKRSAIGQDQFRPLPQPWRGIFELSGQTNGRYVLRNSFIHSREPPQTRVRRWLPSVLSMDIYYDDEDSEMNDGFSTDHSTREPSAALLSTNPNHQRVVSRDLQDTDISGLYSHELPGLEGPDLLTAALLMGCYRSKEHDEPLASSKADDENADLYDDDPNIYLDAESPREVWEANRRAENPRFTALCSNNDPQCPYTTLSTRMHYHCPEEKCRLSKPTSPTDPSASASGVPGPENSLDECDPNHIHCVSRLGPFPDSAGECHLQSSLYKYPDHKCCYWKDEFVDGMTSRGKRAYEKKKLEEAKRKHMRILDRSGEIAVSLGQGQIVGIRDCESLGGLGEAGRGLLGELESGGLDGEVATMGEVIGGMRDELETMNNGSDDHFGF